ncbi:MAG TPA: hypothetical protein VGH97_15440 [Thermoanaerobaculia bacterium]
MRSRLPALLVGGALLLFLLRHPIELRLLRHRSAALPDPSAEPKQLAEERPPFPHGAGGHSYRLIPRFRWDESARVVGAESHHFGAAASLLPVDLALAWGPLLVPPYAGKIHYSQYSRYYFWRTRDGSLDRGTIVSHSANTHLVPATARLQTAIGCVTEGDLVRLQGWLVDVEGIDDPRFRWATSTTREDEGPASCETVYLERLTINERVYE